MMQRPVSAAYTQLRSAGQAEVPGFANVSMLLSVCTVFSLCFHYLFQTRHKINYYYINHEYTLLVSLLLYIRDVYRNITQDLVKVHMKKRKQTQSIYLSNKDEVFMLSFHASTAAARPVRQENISVIINFIKLVSVNQINTIELYKFRE